LLHLGAAFFLGGANQVVVRLGNLRCLDLEPGLVEGDLRLDVVELAAPPSDLGRR